MWGANTCRVWASQLKWNGEAGGPSFKLCVPGWHVIVLSDSGFAWLKHL